MGYTLDGWVDGMVTRTLSTHGRSNITPMSFQLGRSWVWVGLGYRCYWLFLCRTTHQQFIIISITAYFSFVVAVLLI